MNAGTDEGVYGHMKTMMNDDGDGDENILREQYENGARKGMRKQKCSRSVIMKDVHGLTSRALRPLRASFLQYWRFNDVDEQKIQSGTNEGIKETLTSPHGILHRGKDMLRIFFQVVRVPTRVHPIDSKVISDQRITVISRLKVVVNSKNKRTDTHTQGPSIACSSH
jgi:hypothetical protein